jgi:hypothetical protein
MQDDNDKPLSWEKVSKYLLKKAPTLQRQTIENSGRLALNLSCLISAAGGI